MLQLGMLFLPQIGFKANVKKMAEAGVLPLAIVAPTVLMMQKQYVYMMIYA